MTPQEKAEELLRAADDMMDGDRDFCYPAYMEKKIARLACDQVMSAVIKNGHEYNFWKEVKEILEK